MYWLFRALTATTFSGEAGWTLQENASSTPGVYQFTLDRRRRGRGAVLVMVIGLGLMIIGGAVLKDFGGFLLGSLVFAFAGAVLLWYSRDRKELRIDGPSRTITYVLHEPNFHSTLTYAFTKLKELALEYPQGQRRAILRLTAEDGMDMILGQGSPADLMRLAYRINELLGIAIRKSVWRRPDAHPVAGPVQILSSEDCASKGACPVCACRLEEPIQRCGRCNTSYHRECWQYFGGCAIYACMRKLV
jgi:hypothetical protein